MAQPEQARVSRAGARLRAARGTKMDLAAGLPPTTRRSKRRMIVISPREEKGSPCQELHLELDLRKVA